jgi:Tol biopolymer transport system component
VIAGAATAWSVRTPPVTRDVVRFSLPWGSRATSSSFSPALSPDGRIVAFGDASGLHAGVQLRWLDRNDPVVIPGTEDAGALAFSPDGSAVAYVTSATGLYTVGLDGQHKTLLHAAKATAFDGVQWAPDGYVYFMDISVIRRVKATGGEAEEVYHVPPGSVTGAGGGALRFPAILNDGRHLGFATRGSGPSDGSVSVLDMATRTATRLAPGIAIVGEHDGWLLWALASGALVAQRIEYGGTPRLIGGRVTLVDNIRVSDSSPVVALSPNGTLVYQSTTSEIARLAWVTRAGAEAEVDTALARPFIGLSLSPDGSRIAVAVVETGDRSTIWSYDIARKTFVRLTDPADFSFRPQWTPDSRRVLFASEHGSNEHLRRIFSVDPELSDSMQVLITRRRHVQEISWPPTGKYIAFREGFDDGGTRRDIFAMQLGDTAVRPLAVTKADEQNPAVSPDGKWLAYSSDETDTPELYLTPFPEGGAKIRVSTSGGVSAIWSRTGKQLYYRDGRGQLLSVAIDASRSNPVGATQVLFDATRFLDVGNGQSFAVTPNDDRFLFIKLPAQTSMSVVVNWWVEAAAKLAAAKP